MFILQTVNLNFSPTRQLDYEDEYHPVTQHVIGNSPLDEILRSGISFQTSALGSKTSSNNMDGRNILKAKSKKKNRYFDVNFALHTKKYFA